MLPCTTIWVASRLFYHSDKNNSLYLFEKNDDTIMQSLVNNFQHFFENQEFMYKDYLNFYVNYNLNF